MLHKNKDNGNGKAKIYTNPTPNENGEFESKTSKDWAKHLKISKHGWLDRVRKFGENAPEVYETKKQAHERMKASMRLTRANKTATLQTGSSVTPLKKRRGNLSGIKIGTWEAENVPDRWAHLTGKP